MAVDRKRGFLVTASHDRSLRWWRSRDRMLTRSVPLDDVADYLAIHPDGRHIAVSMPGHGLQIVDGNSGRLLRKLPRAQTGSVSTARAAWSPDGRKVAYSDDESLLIYDLQTNRAVKLRFENRISWIGFHPRGLQLVVAAHDGYLLRVADGKRLVRLPGWAPAEARFLGNGDQIQSTGTYFEFDEKNRKHNVIALIRDHDLKSGRELQRRSIPEVPDSMWSASFSPDGTRLALGLRDGTELLLDVSAQPVRRLFKYENSRPKVAFLNDEMLASAGGYGSFRFWSARDGGELPSLARHKESGEISVMQMHRRGIVATGHRSGAIHVWSAQTGFRTLYRPGDWHAYRIDLSLEGDALLALCGSAPNPELGRFHDERSWRVWDLHGPRAAKEVEWAHGRLLLDFDHYLDYFNKRFQRIRFSGGGSLESFSHQEAERRWRITTERGYSVSALDMEEGWVDISRWPSGGAVGRIKDTLDIEDLAFSPDRRQIVLVGDQAAHFWELPTLRRIRAVPLGRWVSAIEFHPSGSLIALGYRNGRIEIRDAVGRLQRELSGHGARISALDFSANGRILFSGSHDGTVRLWRIPEGKAVATLTGFARQFGLVQTPDGLFDVSDPEALAFVWFRVGDQLLPADRFPSLRRTGLLRKVLAASEVAKEGRPRDRSAFHDGHARK